VEILFARQDLGHANTKKFLVVSQENFIHHAASCLGLFQFTTSPSYILTDNGPLQQISGKVGETAMNVVHTFELVWIDAEENRTVLNPDNSEMLHDIFSELLAESRDNQ
jgi:hypothetical protein